MQMLVLLGRISPEYMTEVGGAFFVLDAPQDLSACCLCPHFFAAQFRE